MTELNLTNRWLPSRLDVRPTAVSKGNTMTNCLTRTAITICLSIFILTMVSCNRHSSIPEKMDLAESIMVSKPDSALSISDEADPEMLGSEKIIWLSLCTAFVLLIIAGYIYHRYRLRKAKSLLEEQENKRLQLEQEYLKRENENLELVRHNAILEKQTAELDRECQSLLKENLRLKTEQLEDESATFKKILRKQKDLDESIENAIKLRIEMLNGLLATQITGNDFYAESYEAWKDRLIQDKYEFMNTTRLAFKVSHPKFIEYLEEHGLTEAEINYVCLYAIGLRGKEVGEYMQQRRHYHISSDIRKKLGIDEHQTNIGIYIRKLMKKL